MPAVRGDKLLTASDLATMCEVDLKTIHNWVDRGRIPHFRTPGRHLRFRAPDVAEFLRTWGYSVPRSLARQSTRGALVLATAATFERIAQVAPDGLQLRHATDPYDALVYAGAGEDELPRFVERIAADDLAGLERALDAVGRDELRRAPPPEESRTEITDADAHADAPVRRVAG